MILSDASLRQLLASGKLSIDPLDDDQIQPASVDLRLSDHFLKVDENRLEAIRLDTEVPYEELTRPQIVIPPHSFLLATTRERIRLPDDVTAFVEYPNGATGVFVTGTGDAPGTNRLEITVPGPNG